MKLTSVRTRLTLWNVGILTLALAGFATAVHYLVQASLLTHTDRSLAREANNRAAFYAALVQGKDEGGPQEIQQIFKRMEEWERRYKAPQPPDHKEFHSIRVLDLRGHALQASFWQNKPDYSSPWDTRAFASAASGKEVYSNLLVDGTPMRIFSKPLILQGKRLGVIQVAHSLADLNALFSGLDHTLLALIPLALLASGLGGAFLAHRALRPVHQIAQAAEELGAEDLSRRLPVVGKDEFSELATTFNGMIGRLEEAFSRLENAYQQQQRFTADASHELRTPLTAIKANTSLALRGERSPQAYREALTAADRSADIMNRLVQDLLLLARSDSGRLEIERRPVEIKEILQNAVAVAAQGRQTAPISLEGVDPSLYVLGDAHHLARLFVNLLENALRHTPVEGRITLSAREQGRQAVIRVEDTGEGIPPEHLPHVGERFYRVDAARSRPHGGTGLGLAICRSIAAAHEGALTIQSVVGQGTVVTVVLPCARAPKPEIASPLGEKTPVS